MKNNKNIHVLPTDNPSRLILQGSELVLSKYLEINEGFSEFNQHIYITSDEEIKEEDWVINIFTNKISFIYNIIAYNADNKNKIIWKKIILTTDQDLINDGVQTIPDEFLEWFVKNPSCERVDVKHQHIDEIGIGEEWACHPKNNNDYYKIIIPKVSKPTSMENKTPMQEAIEICEAIMQNSSDTKVFETAKLIKYRLKNELLEKEKELLIDFHCEGQNIEESCGVSDAKDYYNEKFKNK